MKQSQIRPLWLSRWVSIRPLELVVQSMRLINLGVPQIVLQGIPAHLTPILLKAT